MKVQYLVLGSFLAFNLAGVTANISAGSAKSGHENSQVEPSRSVLAPPGNEFVPGTGVRSRKASANESRSDSLPASASSGPGLLFVPVTPCRVADTRNPDGPFGGPEPTANSITTFNIPQSACNIPSTAVAYSLNVTVVPKGSLNYLTLWPSGQTQPNVSTLNSDGRVKANAAIVPAGENGGVSVFVTDPTQVILDIDGYFVPAGTANGLAFYPVTPCRIADTRNPAAPLGGPFVAALSSRDFPILSSSCDLPLAAQAYSLNVTAIPKKTLNYLTIWPTGETQPNVSTLNSSTGAVTANAAIVPAGSNGDISVFVYNDADVILDVNGYFAPPSANGLSLYTVSPCRVLDTRSATGNFNGVLPVNVEGSTCAPPSTSKANVLNATVVPPGSLNYLTLWPDGEAQPNVSTLNADDGAITSNMAIVPTNNGSIDAFSSDRTQLILDISSYFAPNTSGSPVAMPGGPYSGNQGEPISFDGSNSTAPQGETLTYAWSFGDGTAGVGANPTHTYVAAGVYTASLTVTDSSGDTNSATATVTVAATGAANAGGPYSGIAGQAVTFNGSGSTAPPGQSLTYSWNFGDGSAAGSGVSPTHSYSVAGIYTVSLAVTDTSGAVSAPATTTATITAAATTPPSITTIAGNGTSGYSGDGAIATSAALSYLGSVAVDHSGNVYIADTSNQRIRKVSAGTFTITTVAGTGTYGYSGDGGPATSAQLSYPQGIAVDNAGNLYIADTDNEVIRKVVVSTGIITTIAGNGQIGFGAPGDGGPATSAELAFPQGIAIDGSGNLYIADGDDSRVRKVTASTGIITTVAGNGYSGYSGDGGPSINATLGNPVGLAVDSTGNLYIADAEDEVIRKVTAATGIITTVAGSGGYGFSGDDGPATGATLNFPEGVAVDAAGNLYIADDSNSRIRKVTVSTGFISTIAGGYTSGYSGDGGLATAAELDYPQGVAVDSGGNVFVADSGNLVVREITQPLPQLVHYVATPVLSVPAGTYFEAQKVVITDLTPGATIYYTVDGTTPSTSSTKYTGAITVSATETVNAIAAASGYMQSGVATAAYAITAITSPEIFTIAGIGTYGFSGDQGSATAAELSSPGSVAIDRTGNVYISDTYNYRVRMVSAATGIITTVAGNGSFGYSGDGGPATNATIGEPQGVAVDSAGNLYIVDNYNEVIRKVTTSTGIISTVAGNSTVGFSGDGGPATSAQFYNPYGVAVDSAGNLYIADTGNMRIREVVASTGIITTVAGNGIYGYSGDGGPATDAQLGSPYGVTVDNAGNFYFSDSNNQVIRKVTLSTGFISTVAGNGTYGFSGDGGTAVNAELAYPYGVAVDGGGNLYIADSGNARIREVVASSGKIATAAGNGNYGGAGDGGPATAAEIGYVQGVAADSAGNIYIPDGNNSVVREVSLSPKPPPLYTPTPGFTLAAGTYDGTQTVGIVDYKAGSVIYYTIDGTTPTTSSSVYSGPITVSSSETVQAIAVAPGYSKSPVATAVYTISPAAAATPIFGLAQGSYTTVQTLTITDSTNGAAIYYTTDGTVPTTGSARYMGAITISSTEIVRAIAIATGYSQSAVATAAYTLTLPVAAAPVLSVGTGTYSGAQTVTITDGTSGAVIYYTLDGTVPTSDSPVYTGPITISSTEILGAIALAPNYAPSAVVTASYTISQQIITVAGNGSVGFSGDGGIATSAAFNGLNGLAVDSAGNIYIPDLYNGRIRKVSGGTHIITTVAGNGGYQVTGDGGPATSAAFEYPNDVAVDSAGNLYITDVYSQRIRKVSASTGIITTAAGTGTYGFSGDGGPATSAEFEYPQGLAVDATGNLYFADNQSQRIRKVTASTGIITTIAGNGTPGFSGDGGPAVSAELSYPTAVAVDGAGNVYIADDGNQRVRKVMAATGIITTVAGNGNYYFSGDGGAATSAALEGPNGVALDSAGNLYISGSGSDRVRKVAVSTGIISTVAGNGAQGYSGDGGLATNAEMANPYGIAVDGPGNIYVADANNSAIREVSSSPPQITPYVATPTYSLVNGTYFSTQTVAITDKTAGATIYYTTDGTTPTASSTEYTGAITVNSTVSLNAIATKANFGQSGVTTASYAITPQTSQEVVTVAGNGSSGFNGDGQVATGASLSYLRAIAVDGAGNLYVADSDNQRIRKIAVNTGIITTVAGNGGYGFYGDGGVATNATLASPNGVAVDGAGNVYISDGNNDRVRKVTASTGIIETVAGTGTYGFSGDGGPAISAEISYPYGVAVDSAGNIYFADSDNQRIRKVTASSGIITTIAGDGSYGFSGDGGPAAAAQLGYPGGLAVDNAGNLYISDSYNQRIREVNASSGIITTVAGSGSGGFSGDGGPATGANLLYPAGIAVDGSGNLYIADAENQRVREVLASTGIITTIAGSGGYGYAGDQGPATSAELANPEGVGIDGSGNVFIADSNNSVVREVSLSPLQFPRFAQPPTFSPYGGTFNGMQAVTILDATPGATIYYTTDGSTPTTSSTVYSGSFIVSSSQHLQAIAVATGYSQSTVSNSYVTIQPYP